MTEETAKVVSELYKEKSSIFSDFREKVKKETIEHLQNRIKEIEQKIDNLENGK